MSEAFWNERYSATEYVYGTEPNEFFAEQLDRLPRPGRLLLPAEGEGRNAVFAASRGWDVDAFDQSEVGRRKALSLAHERGVSLSYALASYETAALPASAYDAVGLIYAHMPSTLRSRMHRAIGQTLRPGGTLILEAFAEEQIHNETGGPRDIDMLYSVDKLRTDFAAESQATPVSIVALERYDADLQEGRFHRGRASVVRLVARAVG